jgi:arsenate reductase (glutaredoxin)
VRKGDVNSTNTSAARKPSRPSTSVELTRSTASSSGRTSVVMTTPNTRSIIASWADDPDRDRPFAPEGSTRSLPSPAMADETCTVLYNPRCSKCRQARDLLAEKGVDADLVHYLDDTPSRDEIVRIAGLLGVDDPREMMRTGEPVYRELGLKAADREALFDAMAEHPILIERPIVIAGDRAVIARPPERLLELVDRA